ncbi:YgcG family protein, partial [Pseudomonas aeruginosa]|nr:YgcG family protein [Pseudomonas aeruginosa]
RKSFHRRLWALLAACLLLGLLSGGLDAPLVWLALLPFQLMLGLLVFGQVRLSGGGGGSSGSSGGGSSSSSSSSSGGFSGGGGSSGGGGASGSW